MMWKWRTVGALGSFAGTCYLVSHRQILHAKSPLDDAFASPSPASIGRVKERQNVPDLNQMELRNVQVFFRHGARSPLRILSFLDQPDWPKDKILGDPSFPAVSYKLLDVRGQPVPAGPYDQMYQKIIFKGGTPAGQLTKTGKEQVYDLGKEIRRKYVEERKLISPTFKSHEVYIRSTNMMRTIESARWLLSGMYGDNQAGDRITIFTEPAEREILYPNHSFCGQLKAVNKKLFKGIDEIPGLRENRIELQKLLDYKEDANNKKKLNYVDLRDEIIARQAHGIPVPETALAMMNEIELYAVKMLTFMVSGSHKKMRKDILRLACGPVLHLVHDNMDASVWNDDFYKLQLYACHDSMLLALLVTLGIFTGKWPPFAADLVFESYEDKAGRRWVRVLYLNEPVHLPGAEYGDVISREKFTALIGPYAITVDSYRQECLAGGEDGENGGDGGRSAGL
ncbi:Lysophosphatidic acid phosphatase type 6 [Hypsibius exemplaris]|uniref:Lysophosphatidic acid phosphatase type 6 n=1 Tax=Hypsibius exemplaris TaxID=2072580 RepID=A0A1W0XDI7_HYPEX|nr:Lysophosphatidic acid phosphatase type 6 [Hypsibius exemplaris]